MGNQFQQDGGRGILKTKFDELDSSMKLLLRFDLILLITLIVSIITYYEIKEAWGLDHQTAINYSFILGFGVGGLVVTSIRHYRRSRL